MFIFYKYKVDVPAYKCIMDEIFKSKKNQYNFKYNELLEIYIELVMLTQDLGNEVISENLINDDDNSQEKKKIIKRLIENLACSSVYIMSMRNLIDEL